MIYTHSNSTNQCHSESNRLYLVCIYFRNFRRRVDYDELVSDGGTRYIRGVYVYV